MFYHKKNWYKELPLNVTNIEMKEDSFLQGRIWTRINSFRIMKRAQRLDKRNNYDYIFAATYETLAFSVGIKLFKKPGRFFILHHNNLDGIKRKLIKKAFLSYAHIINHLVLEDFIKNALVQYYGISPDRVTYLPHPMNKNENLEKDKIYDGVGISNSNDENVIKQIVSIEQKENLFKHAGKKVILRSKEMNFDNGYLKVISGYLKESDYNTYINRAKAILMLFPPTYINRMSGVLIDALSNGIPVYGTKIPVVQAFSHRYPSLCNVIDRPEKLFEVICGSVNQINQDEFLKFEEEHSENRITTILKKIFV